MVGSPGFEFPGAKPLLNPSRVCGSLRSTAPAGHHLVSVDPQHPLEPTVLAKLHYDPTE